MTAHSRPRGRWGDFATVSRELVERWGRVLVTPAPNYIDVAARWSDALRDAYTGNDRPPHAHELSAADIEELTRRAAAGVCGSRRSTTSTATTPRSRPCWPRSRARRRSDRGRRRRRRRAVPARDGGAVRALGDRAVAIRGNGERELVEARLRLDAGTARIDPGDIWSTRTHWAAGVLDRERLEWMARPAAALLGRDRRTRRRPLLPRLAAQRRGDRDAALARGARRADARRRGAAHRRPRPHARAVRPAGRRHRLVNAGSVGMPYEARAAAYWALLGPGVELRRTRYDVTAFGERVRASGIPEAEDYAEGSRGRRAPTRRTSSSSAWRPPG